MSEWFAQAVDRAQQVATTQNNTELSERLSALRWPTRKTEAWRYTSLFALADKQFASSTHEVCAPAIDNLDAVDIAFDGQKWLVPADLPAGLSINAPQAHGVATKPAHHLFGTLSDALASDTLSIDVAVGADITTPIRVVINGQHNVEQHARLKVNIAAGASFEIIEHLSSDGQGLSSLFSEYEIADDALLKHYRIELGAAEHFNIGGLHIRLNNRSKLDSHVYAQGSSVGRLDADIEHAGEHAFAKMNAIYLLKDREHFDLHTVIEHAKPNGTSEENVRGIVADKSKAVFNGRIHIHRDAQKTLAELNNRNLMLSRDAEINTKPELEIYADDVRCAHGATVAETDEQSLYYLTSRGISKKNAQIMLNFGFINELVEQMPNQAMSEWVKDLLRQRFALMAK